MTMHRQAGGEIERGLLGGGVGGVEPPKIAGIQQFSMSIILSMEC